VAQVDEILAQAREQHEAAAQRELALALRLRSRRWLPPELARRLLAAHAHTRGVLAALTERLQGARGGFSTLPVDERLEAVVPVPVLPHAVNA
jgi:hypothetical protein